MKQARTWQERRGCPAQGRARGIGEWAVRESCCLAGRKAQAEAGRKDEGNLRFDVLQWEGHPNHFTLVEVWRDRKAFDASVAAAHTKDFRQKVTPLEGALYDERLYQVLS